MKSLCCSSKCKVSVGKAIRFLKIISDENRLRIICLLNRGTRCVCEIWQELKIPQNLASHHLKVLKDFKLLTSEKRGLKVIYALDKKVLAEYQAMLGHYLNPNPSPHEH